MKIWVATNGSDAATGTEEKPFATIQHAQQEVLELRRRSNGTLTGPVHIVLRGGTFALTKPLLWAAGDSGTAKSPTIIESAPGEKVTLSGGIKIADWEAVSGDLPGLPERAHGKVWVATAPRLNGEPLEIRQLWVNNHKAIRARQPNADGLLRLVAWDKTNQLAIIPSDALAGIRNPQRLEMTIDQVWEIAILRVQTVRYSGSNALLTFYQPESQLEFSHPWPPVIVNEKYQAPFFLANAIEFLDEPGEWFEDLAAGKIYYWPRPDEDLPDAQVTAPALETLVNLQGTLSNPVAHVQFKNIHFAHTTWLRPSERGHVPLQAGMFLLDAKKLSPHGTDYHAGLDNLAFIGRPPAAVIVSNGFHIAFEGCAFEHLGAAGLDFETGTSESSIEGCTFRDIAGNGIQLGKFSDPDVETHIPYNPSDAREICSSNVIANNVIHDCGTEDWGCVGIVAGYTRDLRIEHNEFFNLPYTGISVGWGWTKRTNCMSNNLIHANHIHHVAQRLGDTAAIYTLSAQPGTLVNGNFIHDLTISPLVPDTNHWFYLYLDEGSSFITVRDNWCPAEKFLRNANGPGNVWENNGPQVSDAIKSTAGPEEIFRRTFASPAPN